MEAVGVPQPLDDEISLRELLKILWDGRLIAVCVTIFCTVAAVAAVWLAPTKYTAVVVLSPAAESSGGAQLGRLSSVASQLGGIASLAGVSMTEDLKKAESIAVLQSATLTQKYIRDNDLLPILYPSKWEAKSKRWKESDPQKIPTLWQANEDFKKQVRGVAVDNKTGLVTLTITWRDPKLAAQWANGIVKVTNEYLRSKAIDQAERNIAYLGAQANKTDVMTVKQALYPILESEINKAMLARGTDEFAFKIIDPAEPPEKPSYPKPKLWIVGGVAAGLFLSILSAFVRLAWRKG